MLQTQKREFNLSAVVIASARKRLIKFDFKGRAMSLNEELLRILACPVCLKPVRELADGKGLECEQCGRIYPIRDGFPVMLPEEATPATKTAAS